MSNSESGGLIDWFAQINSFLRTILGLAIAAGLGIAGWFGYSTYYAGDQAKRELETTKVTLNEQKVKIEQQDVKLKEQAETIQARDLKIGEQDTQIKQQAQEISLLTKENKRLDLALRLLKVDHRLARITVLDQGTRPNPDDAGKMETFTRIEFVEVNEEGQPLGEAKKFDIKGDMVFVEYWVVKFEDKYIEVGDLLRATSICLFRRLFGEQQKPADGFVLDEVGSRPLAYARGSQLTDFEKRIWADFWNIANDPDKAKSLGIRAAHSEAPAIKLLKGKRYKLLLRATGEISITPEDLPDPRAVN